MRKKSAFIIVGILLALIVPAAASAVDREIATTCYGSLISQRFNPIASWPTGVPCNGYVPSLDKPWYVINRPDTDLYAAADAARHFWPNCDRSGYSRVDKRDEPGHWVYTFFHITNCH